MVPFSQDNGFDKQLGLENRDEPARPEAEAFLMRGFGSAFYAKKYR
jgi:hypothetical protein